MLGNKRDRSYDERDPVGARSANLVVGRWADPLQRPDTALIADRPIEPRLVQSGDHRCGGCLNLIGVGVAGPHDPGSPYAIGSSAGGHEAIAPELVIDGFADAPCASRVVPGASTCAPRGVTTSALPERTVTSVRPEASTLTR